MVISEAGPERLGLKPDAEPAVPVLFARVAARGHRIGEDEEPRLLAALAVEPLDEQPVLVFEHRLQAGPADVAIAVPVDGVAEGHVVGRHGLGDGAGRASDAEEPARHFLARANLGERAVFDGIQVHLERLGVRVGLFLCHVWTCADPVIDRKAHDLKPGAIGRRRADAEPNTSARGPRSMGWPHRVASSDGSARQNGALQDSGILSVECVP